MNKYSLLLLSILSANAFAIPFEISKKIDRGQTEGVVLSVAGNPQNRSYAGSCDGNRGIKYQWLYMKKEDGERDIMVTFCNGKVESVESIGWR